MMKSFVMFLTLFAVISANSQSVLNSKSLEELRYMRENRMTKTAFGDTISNERTPLEYGYIDPKDVIWSQLVWEVIDLNERLNQPYFFSSKGLINSSISLYEALLEGVKREEIPEIYSDEYFGNKMELSNVLNAMKITKKSKYCIEQEDAGVKLDSLECYDTFELLPEDIRFMKIKGMWYIDKRQGEMRYRLLGIAPLGPDLEYLSSDAAAAVATAKLNPGFGGDSSTGAGGGGLFGDEGPVDAPEEGLDKKEMGKAVAGISIENGPGEELLDLFWVYYPSARRTLHNYNVFNPKNLSSSLSFDDLLNARRFHSIVYKVEDGFDRTVAEYYPNDAVQQLEFDKEFKERIYSRENEMWQY